MTEYCNKDYYFGISTTDMSLNTLLAGRGLIGGGTARAFLCMSSHDTKNDIYLPHPRSALSTSVAHKLVLW
jgi:hypothetical protein